jgi:hypothetical protein
VGHPDMLENFDTTKGGFSGKKWKSFPPFLGSELSKYVSYIFWNLNFPPKSKYTAYHDIRATWAMCTAAPLFVPLDLAWFFFFSLLYTFHGQSGTQWQQTILHYADPKEIKHP